MRLSRLGFFWSSYLSLYIQYTTATVITANSTLSDGTSSPVQLPGLQPSPSPHTSPGPSIARPLINTTESVLTSLTLTRSLPTPGVHPTSPSTNVNGVTTPILGTSPDSSTVLVSISTSIPSPIDESPLPNTSSTIDDSPATTTSAADGTTPNTSTTSTWSTASTISATPTTPTTSSTSRTSSSLVLLGTTATTTPGGSQIFPTGSPSPTSSPATSSTTINGVLPGDDQSSHTTAEPSTDHGPRPLPTSSSPGATTTDTEDDLSPLQTSNGPSTTPETTEGLSPLQTSIYPLTAPEITASLSSISSEFVDIVPIIRAWETDPTPPLQTDAIRRIKGIKDDIRDFALDIGGDISSAGCRSRKRGLFDNMFDITSSGIDAVFNRLHCITDNMDRLTGEIGLGNTKGVKGIVSNLVSPNNDPPDDNNPTSTSTSTSSTTSTSTDVSSSLSSLENSSALWSSSSSSVSSSSSPSSSCTVHQVTIHCEPTTVTSGDSTVTTTTCSPSTTITTTGC
ncbi:hypothetical protein ASPCAL09641 [Aspergillus calidoustus]|uniref:Uncharacterized protein n=1 Tax=Aspergillus calidoustus TaxID=454130 RepID=A0A0U5G428_ASPCI|nr:hypothetical protein ASPCAL09641 [Aspergillus calidoustus]